MATVREGVMKKEVAKTPGKGVVKKVDHKKYTSDADFVVRIIEREMEERKINIKGAPVIIAGGYGMGCKENFALLHELAEVLGGEVGASRAAVDAGRPCPPDRTDRRDGTSETLYRLRHLGTDPAHRRHGRLVDDHLDQYGPGSADQQNRRLRDHGRRNGSGTQDD